MHEQIHEVEKPSLVMALLPIILTMGLLMVQLFVFDDFTPHVPLAIGILIAGAFAWRRGYKWPSIAEGMYHVASVGLPSLAILMTVGMIIGVWILSGTVPVLIYYGLGILTPGIFLVAGCLVCALISLATGTSMGHNRNGRPGPGGNWRRFGYTDASHRWRRCVGCFFWRQNVTVIGYNQSSAGCVRNKLMGSHPWNDSNNRTGNAGGLSHLCFFRHELLRWLNAG